MNARSLIFFGLTLFTLSCTDFATTEVPESNPINGYPSVDADLWPYFESFEYEAALRNIPVDLARERIIGSIENISESNVVGQCSYGRYAHSHVVIDENFWSRANYFAREMIVFHELGHCFLFRDHREGRFENGSCISIMRSGLQSCRDNYHSRSREYYLDELFSVNNRG